MALPEFKISIEFVEILNLERVEVRATMPDAYDSYRIMFVMPTSLYHASNTITEMVSKFAIELARQWLTDGGMQIAELHVHHNPDQSGTKTN